MGHLHFGTSGRVKQGTPDAWLPVAAQIARYARSFAGRKDIVANVGPDVGGPYATACWAPHTADLDVNTGTCLPGYVPDRVDLNDEVFQLGAQPFMGAITHEAAHAKWTCWTPYDLKLRRKAGYEEWTQATIEVVVSLEESRIERLAVMADPTRRAALARCALSIVLRDFKVNNTLFGASISLALTVGRYAILSPEEVDRFREIIAPHLPLGLMGKLEKLVREYHAMPAILAKDGHYPDSYFRRMFDIAQRWLVAIRETAAKIEEIERKARERREAEERAAEEKAEREAAERAEEEPEEEPTDEAEDEPSEDDEPAADVDVDAEYADDEGMPEDVEDDEAGDEDESDDVASDGPEDGDEDAEPGEGGEDDETDDGAGDEPDDEGAGDPVETGETDDETEGEAAPEKGSGSPESTESGARGEDADDHDDAEGVSESDEGEPTGAGVEAARESGDTDVERFEEPESGAESDEDDEDGDLDQDGAEGAPEPSEDADDDDDYEDDDYADAAYDGEPRGEREDAREGVDTSDVEHRYDEEGEEELDESEPARDVQQPQPDLRSGIPGEDEMGEAVVVIIFEAEDGAEDDEDAPEDDEPEDSSLGDAIKDAAGAAAMDRESEALDERKEKVTARALADGREDASRRAMSADVMKRRHGADKDGFSTFCDSHRLLARAPEGGERVAANRLAATLERITFHDRAVKKVDRVVPGGKLRPRAAVAKAADRARGGRAEIPEWRAKERKHTSETPITVGILTDVSGSMGNNSAPSAVLTYVLSNAVSRIDGKVATAVFGSRGYLVNRAYERATEVQPWRASDGTEAFREGSLLLDAELSLLDGEGARILVVFTDSDLVNPVDADYARTFMRLCKRKNVAVVWCSYNEMPISNYGHGALLDLSGSAADIANTLGAAIVAEVQKIEASRGA